MNALDLRVILVSQFGIAIIGRVVAQLLQLLDFFLKVFDAFRGFLAIHINVDCYSRIASAIGLSTF